MTSVWTIARRELGAYARSPLGAVVVAASLTLNGVLFYTQALSQKLLSGEVLARFFYNASGVTAVAALLLSFRLISEERQTRSFTLLNTAPVSGLEIVCGKFLSAWLMVAALTLLSVYMPVLVFVHGKVSVGHIVVGYLGLFLLGSAASAIGVFASSVARSQVVSVIVGALILALLFVSWMLAAVTEAPLSAYLSGLAFHHVNFSAFQNGVLELQGVAYYLAVTYFFLLSASKVLEARRWR